MNRHRSLTPQELALKIKSLRKGIGLTVREEAKVLGMAEPTIKKYESGERTPPLDVRQRMSEIFQVPLIELIEWSGEDGKSE